MVRRSRLEIFFDVLAVIDRGHSKPTHIMYNTNLSWPWLQKALETLINRGFIQIEETKNSKRYSITDKGRNALAYHLQSIEDLIQVHQRYDR